MAHKEEWTSKVCFLSSVALVTIATLSFNCWAELGRVASLDFSRILTLLLPMGSYYSRDGILNLEDLFSEI